MALEVIIIFGQTMRIAKINLLSSLTIIITITISLFASESWATCQNRDELLSNPKPQESAKCITFILKDLSGNKPIDENYINRFIINLLKNDSPALTFMYPKIVDIISLLKSVKLLEAYTDHFINISSTVNRNRQVHQEALAKLFILQAPIFLEVLKNKSSDKQEILIQNLALGVESYFFPHINKNNYRRLLVGEYWELLTSDLHKSLRSRIESALHDVVIELN